MYSWGYVMAVAMLSDVWTHLLPCLTHGSKAIIEIVHFDQTDGCKARIEFVHLTQALSEKPLEVSRTLTKSRNS